MTPRFLSKERLARIIVWMCLAFCLIIVIGYAIRLASGRHIGLDQIAAVAGIISFPGSIVASAIGWMRGQLKDLRDFFTDEISSLQQQLDAHEQLMNGILVNQGAHEKLTGHPGIVEALDKLRGTVLRNEAQVEVFGRFQKVYEQQVKLSEEVAYLKGLAADGTKNSSS